MSGQGSSFPASAKQSLRRGPSVGVPWRPMEPRPLVVALAALAFAACTTPGPPPPRSAPAPTRSPPLAPLAQERHFAELRQISVGGENAEAYWAFGGGQLSLQARRANEGCDRIYTMDVRPAIERGELPIMTPVSSGLGATTCAHFLPGDDEVIFASTHLGGAACPPRPDMSQGYVWALYDSYDIFRAKRDGGDLVRLTETPGYDAEGTVCAKDGAILFTSVRDGDLDLYRMDRDGKNVRRLTNTPGYDGGGFFNADCTQIVWRASRPRPGKELDDYRALLQRGLVRPTKLELYVANADGSEARQVTYLGVASFAPFFDPSGRRILFSSNYPDPRGREFDLWAVNVDGTGLERITYAPGFDGFPMFSPDGKWLAFSSNRATAPGQPDTNLFVARWVDDAGGPRVELPPDRVRPDVAWLAAPERQGRGVGSAGLAAAGEWLESRFKSLGLEPITDGGSLRQPFQVTTEVRRGATALRAGKEVVAEGDFVPLGWSGQGRVRAPLVAVGYGLENRELGLDDYAGRDVQGKVVLVRRFVPDHPKLDTPERQRREGDLRRKAFVARSHGAAALLVVDLPERPGAAPADWRPPSEAPLPVLAVKRALGERWLAELEAAGKRRAPTVELQVALEMVRQEAWNVAGRLRAKAPSGGPVIVGAHYDHLGLGGAHSLAPDRREPHLGADDNASGVAGLLEVARRLGERRGSLARDVWFVAFSGEEEGVLGSSHFVAAQKASLVGAAAMLNLDMVGRLRGNQLTVLGTDSADGWSQVVEEACAAARLACNGSGDGYGPSDQTPFYAAGLPVLHFFTGAHSDYHKPSDAADRINYGGLAKVAEVVATVAETLGRPEVKLAYKRVSVPLGRGDARSFGASLGTVPDYAGPPAGRSGVLLADVRVGGGAERGGMRRGDLLIRLGKDEIRSVEDLMFVLMAAKPGETRSAVVLRDGREVRLEVTFQEGRRR